MSLLEKAKGLKYERKTKLNFTDEQIEFIFAWLRGEITTKQYCYALDKPVTNNARVYHIGMGLRQAYQQGLLVIKK